MLFESTTNRTVGSMEVQEEFFLTASKAVFHPNAGRARIEPNEPAAGYNLVLICRSCGYKWSIQPGPDGYFFPGFWLCPRRCDS